jgi:capsule polysaccharide export protein KpsE/RkpR
MKYIVALTLTALLAVIAIGRAQSPADEVSTLEAELAALLLTYTDTYPAARALTARIEALKMADAVRRFANNLAGLEAELATLRLTYTETYPAVRAVIERIEALKEADAVLQSARAELARLRLTYTDQHPLVQAQLAKIRTLQQQ